MNYDWILNGVACEILAVAIMVECAMLVRLYCRDKRRWRKDGK